ncbi:MAG: hypothetical protein JSW06_02750 [Thermoplasmatales archaeon]|nr:MAG: hypothetical protein JSW06_02750 [Thermoplasmatales archaeon]
MSVASLADKTISILEKTNVGHKGIPENDWTETDEVVGTLQQMSSSKIIYDEGNKILADYKTHIQKLNVEMSDKRLENARLLINDELYDVYSVYRPRGNHIEIKSKKLYGNTGEST